MPIDLQTDIINRVSVLGLIGSSYSRSDILDTCSLFSPSEKWLLLVHCSGCTMHWGENILLRVDGRVANKDTSHSLNTDGRAIFKKDVVSCLISFSDKKTVAVIVLNFDAEVFGSGQRVNPATKGN